MSYNSKTRDTLEKSGAAAATLLDPKNDTV